jgi:transcriptional regulator with XRE-family HTH domain
MSALAATRMAESDALDAEAGAAFAAELAAIRADSHLSLERFAAFADVDHTQVSRVERRVRTPSRWFVKQIAEALYPGDEPGQVVNRDGLYLAAGYAPPGLAEARSQCALLGALYAILRSPHLGQEARDQLFRELRDTVRAFDGVGSDQADGWHQLTIDDELAAQDTKEATR